MADVIPHDFLRAMAAGEIAIGTHTFKCALFTSSATVGPDVTGLSGLGANEVANGNGYTTGGATVTMTITDDDGNNRAAIDSSNPSWTASGGNIGPFRYAVWYDDTHASDQVAYILDLGADVTIVNGQPAWTITVDALGLITIAQAA